MTIQNPGAVAGHLTHCNQLLFRILAHAICMLVFTHFPARAAQVALRWQDNSNNEHGYKVERATGAGAYTHIATTAANVVKHIDATAASSTTYKYRVFAYNTLGSSMVSNIATVTTPSSTANTAPTNQAPTITGIPNHSGNTGSSIGPVAFTIADGASAAASLTVSASSSNTSLVPLSGLALAGNDANRTITITPAARPDGYSDGHCHRAQRRECNQHHVHGHDCSGAAAHRAVGESFHAGSLPYRPRGVDPRFRNQWHGEQARVAARRRPDPGDDAIQCPGCAARSSRAAEALEWQRVRRRCEQRQLEFQHQRGRDPPGLRIPLRVHRSRREPGCCPPGRSCAGPVHGGRG